MHIPASVQKIADGEGDRWEGWTEFGAFHGCEKLQRVTFANGSQLKEIGRAAFFGCKILRNVVLPECLEIIGGWSFCETGLAKIMISKNTKRIGEYAFYECENLKKATLA